jgi:SET domain-containing protein
VKHVAVAPARNGLGLFAAKAFKPGQTLLKIAGRVVHHRVLWQRRGSTFSANCFRYGPETYLDPGDHVGRYLNHSCEPNAAIRKRNNQIFLVAAAPIERGAEIVFDYSTTIGDDDIWTMRCNCGAPSCRGRIKRFGTLPRAVQERYLGAGLVPNYIIATLD